MTMRARRSGEMIRKLIFVFGAVAVAAVTTGPLRAEELDTAKNVVAASPEESTASQTAAEPPMASPTAAPAASAEAEALRIALSSPDAGNSDEERNESAALISFYESRNYEPLWLMPAGGLTPKASLLVAEIKRADEWGLDPHFPLPKSLDEIGASLTPETVAVTDIKISRM